MPRQTPETYAPPFQPQFGDVVVWSGRTAKERWESDTSASHEVSHQDLAIVLCEAAPGVYDGIVIYPEGERVFVTHPEANIGDNKVIEVTVYAGGLGTMRLDEIEPSGLPPKSLDEVVAAYAESMSGQPWELLDSSFQQLALNQMRAIQADAQQSQQ